MVVPESAPAGTSSVRVSIDTRPIVDNVGMLVRPPAVAALCVAQAAALDLKNATIVAPPGLASPEKKAAAMLGAEIEKRTRIRLPIAERAPASGAAIVLGPEA